MLACTSRLGEGVALMDERMGLSQALAQQGQIAEAARFWSSLGAMQIRYGRVEKGMQTLALPARLAHARSLDRLDAAALAEHRAQGLVELGRFDEAAAALHEAGELRRAAAGGASPELNPNLVARARLLLARRRGEEAAAAVAAIQVSPREGEPMPDALERDVLAAEAALARDRLDEAIELATRAQAWIAVGPSPADFGLFTQRLETVLGLARWRAGSAIQALDHLERA